MSFLKVGEINVKEKDDEVLKEIFHSRKPCVIHGLDIGPARSLWTAEYLGAKCGTREVKVHVCPTNRMDFINKNFVYR